MVKLVPPSSPSKWPPAVPPAAKNKLGQDGMQDHIGLRQRHKPLDDTIWKGICILVHLQYC